MEPFALHDDQACDWLANLIVAHEMEGDFGDSHQAHSADTPPINKEFVTAITSQGT